MLSIAGNYPLTKLTISTNSSIILLGLMVVGIEMGACIPTFSSLAQSNFKQD
ncbi:hypothetical protein FD46_GL000736 [Liquorilactobacillus oeni DSM 19972]|uniref:Uncharacterized protein n=1 Tax=Liquorilactobacillus oeni DSM 19972 TaxID=1423777 RepID=A0A0R1MB42_9LACO|nr:hypothetical protein FD46_GL000736 [Liquorilactobacillus oeni DSM 19972]